MPARVHAGASQLARPNFMKKIEPGRGFGGPRTSRIARQRELVLYVEDDDDNWRVADLRLSDNYEILRAPNAREACRLLQQRGTEFAAILMDVELRGSDLNGIEITQLLRGKLVKSAMPDYAKSTPVLSTPIIFVTAHGAKYSDAHLLLAGGDKVIPKPVDFAVVSLALTQLHLAHVALKRRRS
jgi:two-component system sensor histidine kinase/response regulator